MLFRLQTEVWMDVQSFSEAEAAMSTVETAALQALGDSATVDPDTGAEATSRLVPADEVAHEALRAEDLGPGITSARRRAGWSPFPPPARDDGNG